jgi:putative phosphoribosyl transferase
MEGLPEENGLDRAVQIPVGSVILEGNLSIPKSAVGLVLFVHGSGSSRHSSRNRFVARVLQQAGLATLLFDLLTAEEEAVDIRTLHLRFDIEFLAERVRGTIEWLDTQAAAQDLHLGLFGSSTGAAAALVSSVAYPEKVHAVVSRGGRPDLAIPILSQVAAPTLLIVGGDDIPVIQMNREAYDRITAVKKMEIVAGAGHLFEEPGTLEMVAELATQWFQFYLSSSSNTDQRD